MYDTSCATSSPLPSRQPFDSDEISIFLHHLLHSSSSSSSPSPKPPTPPLPSSHPIFSDDHNRNSDCRVPGTSSSTIESSSGLILSSSGIYFPPDTPIHSLGPSATVSPSVAAASGSGVVAAAADCDAVTVSVKRKRFPSENDLEDFECESEEGFEASDGPSKQSQPRGSSKRSRAAEVHNLSEKRRRSRINEKMKALQNLIPNSNKTDKASMLDEAIEYLKQLQVQVQMLSMRNGFSLHPMYLPGVVQPLQLPQMRMAFNEGSRVPLHVNIGRDTLPVNQESSTLTFGLSNQCTTSNQPMIAPDMKNITTSETSYGLDSSAQVNQEAFRLPPPDSEEMYGEHILAQQKLYINQSSRSLSEDDKVKAMVAASLPFDSRIPIMEHPGSLKAHVSHRERSQDMLSKDVDSERILLQQLHRQD